MPIVNLDLKNKHFTQLLTNLSAAMAGGDETAVNAAGEALGQYINDAITESARSMTDMADRAALAARGIRTLTSEEHGYYTELINAMKSNNPKQAIANIDKALPQTIFDAVMDDITTNHPLLDAISFTNTSALTKWIYNKQGVQTAAWGKLTSAITKELEGAIDVIELTACKLTAFMPISNDMLDLGPEWVDGYVRATLTEAIATELETAIVTGTGKDQPIGMDRNVGTGVTVSDGVYPQKNAIALDKITPAAFGSLLASMAVSPSGRPRAVDGLIWVVNPAAYYKTVMPATTFQTPDATYQRDVLPVPCKIIPSVALTAERYSVIGMGKRYFMGVGTGGKSGRLEADDSVRFLEDETVYKIKVLGNGRPMDNNAFIRLDINGLKPAAWLVEIANAAEVGAGG